MKDVSKGLDDGSTQADTLGDDQVIDLRDHVLSEQADSDQATPKALEAQDTPEQRAPAAKSSGEPSRRSGILTLAILVAGLVVASINGKLPTTILVFGILFLIMFHELGHFLAAKAFNMKATEFFVGFGPRLWSTKRGETEYGVRAIPLGGFVKVIGMSNTEEVDPSDEARTYRQRPFWQRIILALAGPFMNIALACILLWAVAVFVGIPNGIDTRVGQVVALQGQSPAAAAGILAGDRIVSIDGTATTEWSQVSDILRTSANKSLQVVLDRNGQSIATTLTPMARSEAKHADGTPIDTTGSATSGFAGISVDESAVQYQRESVFAAVPSTFDRLWNGTIGTAKQFQKMFSPDGVSTYAKNVVGAVPEERQAEADANRFLSPVGLVNFADQAAADGWFNALLFLAAINVSVGVFNLIPLLPFDGGHAVIAAYGWVRSIGKKTRHVVDYRRLEPAMFAVVATLILIFVTSMWLDIIRPTQFG